MTRENFPAQACIAVRKGTGTSRWPRQDLLELGAVASAVPYARLHTRRLLQRWGLGRLGEAAELLVAELVANAIEASCPAVAPVRLWLLSGPAQVVILVWDASPSPPVRVNAGNEAEGGRGLMLVEAVSEQWGWCPGEDGGGKFVWASILAELWRRNVPRCPVGPRIFQDRRGLIHDMASCLVKSMHGQRERRRKLTGETARAAAGRSCNYGIGAVRAGGSCGLQ